MNNQELYAGLDGEKRKTQIFPQKEMPSCDLCGKNHVTSECILNDPNKAENYSKIKGEIKLRGITWLQEKGVDALLGGFPKGSDQRNEIIDELVSFYKLGEKTEKVGVDGEKIYEGKIFISGNAENKQKMKIDKKPIDYDPSFGYVLRYHDIDEDGTVNRSVRNAGLSLLSRLVPDIQDEIEEINRKLKETY